MHDHADGAMIGIGGRGMDVSHLDKRQQGEQQQTDQRSRTHSPWLALAPSFQTRLAADFH